MDLVHPICCGLDVHKAQVTANMRRVEEGGRVCPQLRIFTTVTRELLALADWLTEAGCKAVAMESTGVYWKPVYHILRAAGLDVVVGNPREIRQRPGKKTDKADAVWISELLAHGLIRNSFIPPREIAALRDYSRTRVNAVNSRTTAKNRVYKLLEDANIKLACTVSDLFGVSGRRMLHALAEGQTDAKSLAEMAKGSLRHKLSELEISLEGCFTEHHQDLLRLLLDEVEFFERQIGDVEQRIAELATDLSQEIALLVTIPGVKLSAARTILAETGRDMTRFESAPRLAAWSGVCPGNKESAGKRLSGRTRKGNRYLRRILTECAWAARKTDTFLGRTFLRLQARIGGKKAAMAVAHKIIVIIYNLLSTASPYDDSRYVQISERQVKRQCDHAVITLERLGFKVSLELAAMP